MIKLINNICLIYILALAGNNCFALEFSCQTNSEIRWESLSEGVQWAKYDLLYTPYIKNSHQWSSEKSRHVTVRAFKVDFSLNQLLFYRPAHDLSCDPTQDRYIHKMIDDSKAPIIGAINASFFVMPNGNTLGIALDEKRIWSNNSSNQSISSSGIFGIENGTTFLKAKDEFMKDYGPIISNSDASRYSFLVQAYPKLLIQNEFQISDAVLESKRPRTSIGVAENPSEIFLVTIDATDETEKTGMSLFEFAYFLRNPICGIGLNTALNLDGGGSTSFSIPSKGIYQQADRCRHLGNILTIQKKPLENFPRGF